MCVSVSVSLCVCVCVSVSVSLCVCACVCVCVLFYGDRFVLSPVLFSFVHKSVRVLLACYRLCSLLSECLRMIS